VKLTTLPPSGAVVIKSGNLNFLEPSGPLQACNGTASTFEYERRSIFSDVTLVVVKSDLRRSACTTTHFYKTQLQWSSVCHGWGVTAKLFIRTDTIQHRAVSRITLMLVEM
jgi:hypothetical protein